MAIGNIKTTSLWKDVDKIINANTTVVFNQFHAVIHNEKYNINVIKIGNLDVVRDYIHNIGDHVHIEFVLAAGDFYKFFFPYKDNCYMTITQKPRNLNNQVIKNVKETKLRYKILYLEKNNVPVNFMETSERMNSTALDLSNFIHVKCQLIDLNLQALRILYTGGVFKKMTYEDILYTTVGADSLKVKVNGKPAIEAIDIVKPDNQAIQPLTVIPDGTPIITLPTYLHESRKGIYSNGLGMYLQNYNNKKTWFIYPLFNTALYDTREYKAIFYVVPPQHFPWIERTYIIDNKVIKVVCTADKHYVSDGKTRVVNKGNAFRMSAAKSYMLKPVIMKTTGPVATRSRMNYEVSNGDMNDGLNYGPMSLDEISDNPFSNYSKVNSRYTDMIHLVWNNSNPDLIYPGMPAKFFYLQHDKLVSIKGIIVNTQTSVQMGNSSMLTGLYYTNTALTILVDKGNSLDKGIYG